MLFGMHWTLGGLLIGFLCGLICVSFISQLKSYFINGDFMIYNNDIEIHGILGLLGSFIILMMIGILIGELEILP